MALVLLDTTVLIDVLRERPAAGRVQALLRTHDIPVVCAVNVEEVHRGLGPSERRHAGELFDALRTVGLSRVQGELAGDWRRSFQERGVTLAQSDCLVAAAAYFVGARIVTGNPKDFPMAEVDVEHWPVGE